MPPRPLIPEELELINATTGMGGLPHTALGPALRASLAMDIPFLPQLPARGPAEFMLPQALEGLPGLDWDGEGRCTVDVEAWRAGRAAFEARLEGALASGDLEAYEPSVAACRAWRPFLREVERRALPRAKAQLAGPFTLGWSVRTREGGAAREVEGLGAAMERLVEARARAMVRALRRVGTRPVFFLDEPGLAAGSGALDFTATRALAEVLREEGARVGVHCCGNTDWAGLLDAGLDVVALDVRLSLDALLEASGPLARFLARGATLCLGLLPTQPTSPEEVTRLVDAVEVSLEAALPPGHALSEVGRRLWLSPACGLSSLPVAQAEAVLGQLPEARRQLQEAWAARGH